MNKVMWADKVTTPEGFTGTITEFDGQGKAKVLFDDDNAPVLQRWEWYDTSELLVGAEERKLSAKCECDPFPFK